MCGIAGIVKFKGAVVPDSLKKMTDVIFHRGPDGEGYWISPAKTVGFGHRRLSIIDLTEKGKQPMHYANGRFTITFNGEIYNYIELKEQLLKDGFQFNSDSDTEVILALYQQKGTACLNELDGMFAFALWDEQEQVLFCARDRFGEKPFYFFSDSEQFIFASEIKQFWPIGIRKKISDQKIKDFLDNGEIDTLSVSGSFYENIQKLEASHYLVINKEGKITKQKYWSLDRIQNNYKGNLDDAKKEFLSIFTEAIRLRLRSDVPVGSSLSGGLDSSSIVMLIDKLKGKELKQNTFSARFKNFAKDEGSHIEAVVNACKNVQAHYTWPDQDYFLENFEKVVHYQDEPFGSASIVAQWSVMELAKKNNVTVLLDGQGADEQMGGYLPYYTLYLDQLFYNNRARFNKEYLAFDKMHGSVFKHIPLNEKETVRMKMGRYKRTLLNKEMPITNSGLTKKLNEDTTRGDLQTLLRYADRNSMAHSREVRLPFLSHKLVEFVFGLPDEFKLNMGWTKYILRKAMENTLPDSICWRVDKVGYEPPQNDWLNAPQINNEIEKATVFFNEKKQNGSNISYLNSKNWRLLMAYKYVA